MIGPDLLYSQTYSQLTVARVMLQNKEVYIIGTPYCGSTFLSNLLNAHPKIFSAGEISGWFKDFTLGVDDAFCPLCATQDQHCSVFNDAFKEKILKAQRDQVIPFIRKAAGKPIIVDSSKFPSWFEYYFRYKAERYGQKSWRNRYWRNQVRVVILSRSPMAYLASIKRRDNLGVSAAKAHWPPLYEEAMKLCEQYDVPFYLLRFETLLTQPEAAVKQLCNWLGVSYASQMLRFWEVPVHSLGGNAGAYMWYKSYREKGKFATTADQQRALEYADRQFSVEKTNSWRSTLKRGEIDKLILDKSTAKIAKKLGYDLDLMSRAD